MSRHDASVVASIPTTVLILRIAFSLSQPKSRRLLLLKALLKPMLISPVLDDRNHLPKG